MSKVLIAVTIIAAAVFVITVNAWQELTIQREWDRELRLALATAQNSVPPDTVAADCYRTLLASRPPSSLQPWRPNKASQMACNGIMFRYIQAFDSLLRDMPPLPSLPESK